MSETNHENPQHTYETLQSQAPSAEPNCNPPVPTYLQNVSPPVPTYLQNVPPSVPNYFQNVSTPLPPYHASPSAQVWPISSVAPQWTVAHVAPNTDPSSPFYQTFLKSKPKALGIVMIIFAILEIAFGIGLGFTSLSITLPSGIPFWGPIFYIIAGSLTIAANAKPNTCLVRGSLALNILSSIFSVVAVILISVDLGTLTCYYYDDDDYGHYHYGESYRCRTLLNAAYVVLAFLLIFNLLLFCVSFSISIFGCRSLSKISSNTPQVFLIQNDLVVSMNPTVPTAFPGTTQPFPPANGVPPPPPYMFQEVKAQPLS